MLSLKQQTATGILWSVVQRWGARLTGLAVFSLLARFLEPKDFGIIALAGVFIAFAEVFTNEGFTQALVQRVDLEPQHLDTAFWVNAGIGCFLTVVSFITAPLLADITSQPQLAAIIRWLSAGFMLNSLSSVQSAILQRDFAYKSLALRRLLGVLLGGMTGIIMAYLNFGVWSLVMQQLVTCLISTVTLWFLSSWRPKLGFHKQHFYDLYAFEISLLGSRLLEFFNHRIDDLLIGIFLGVTTLGFYNVAYRIYAILNELFASSISTVMFVSFSRMQGDRVLMGERFYTVTRLTSLVSFPIFISLAFVAPEFIEFVFGAQWARSTPVLQILVFMGLLQAFSRLNIVVIRALGKPAWEFYINVLHALSTVTGFFIAVRFGINAVALAYVVPAYLLAPIALIAVDKLISISFRRYFHQITAPLVSTGITLVAIVLLKNSLGSVKPVLQLLASIMIGGTTYIIAIYAMAPDLILEVRSLIALVLRRPGQLQNQEERNEEG